MNVPIVIPAYNPPDSFLSFITTLRKKKLTPIIIIDDGSHASYAPLFAKLERKKNITVYRHKQNRGKGQAIKTAMRQIKKKFPNALGAIFADADGQHSPEDIQAIQRLLKTHKTNIIIGKRSLIAMPLKNRVGNVLSSLAIRVCFHTKIIDTQNGLRALPKQFFSQLIRIPGNRYEYETGMLLWAIKQHIPIYEHPIQTIYTIDRYSHYRSFADTGRILQTIIRSILKMKNASI